jgi:hypothetical protein
MGTKACTWDLFQGLERLVDISKYFWCDRLIQYGRECWMSVQYSEQLLGMVPTNKRKIISTCSSVITVCLDRSVFSVSQYCTIQWDTLYKFLYFCLIQHRPVMLLFHIVYMAAFYVSLSAKQSTPTAKTKK